MRCWLRCLLVQCLAFSAAHAACVAHADAERVDLVELYTSEGCSSCPPAERWLSTLRDKAGYVGLEFHVDYWNSGGWRDPYADARYTARQKASARHGTRDIIYTPQVFVDGQLWKNWPKADPPGPADLPAPALSLAVTPGTPLQVSVDTQPAESAAGDGTRDYGVYVALTENGLSNDVTGGENRGEKLVHDQVVRAFAGPLPMPHATTELAPPRDADLHKSAVVAFVQDQRRGNVVQVLRLPLAACGN